MQLKFASRYVSRNGGEMERNPAIQDVTTLSNIALERAAKQHLTCPRSRGRLASNALGSAVQLDR